MITKNLNGYNLVYQGGNHNVYCNGVEHAITVGGYTANAIDIGNAATYGVKKCDCEKWKMYRDGETGIPPIFENAKITINRDI